MTVPPCVDLVFSCSFYRWQIRKSRNDYWLDHGAGTRYGCENAFGTGGHVFSATNVKTKSVK